MGINARTTLCVAMLYPLYATASCLVLGDSIALGTGQQLPQCRTVAKVGRTTAQIIKSAPSGHYDLAVISAGTNDMNSAPAKRLHDLRSRIDAVRVVWIVPAGKFRSASLVPVVAGEYGDSLVRFDGMVSADGIHPTANGYKYLAWSASHD